MMETAFSVNATSLVDEWVRHWQREGRLDGGLDKVARADLVSRISETLNSAGEPHTASKTVRTGTPKGRRAQ